MQIHRGETPLQIICDASYVCRGFDGHNRAKYMKGPNADIWGRIYSRMDELRIKPTLHKVKSHITIEEIMVCCEKIRTSTNAVSYTHLTLPTKRIV